MSWVKTGDEFTERPMWDGVPYEARWHYLALVGLCSRTKRWDGLLPLKLALRASDVPDPERCHDELVLAGAVTMTNDSLTITGIDEHMPSAGVRANTEQAKLRMRAHRERQRLHAIGDHSQCLDKCPFYRTGLERRDGTGRDGELLTDEQNKRPLDYANNGRNHEHGTDDQPAGAR